METKKSISIRLKQSKILQIGSLLIQLIALAYFLYFGFKITAIGAIVSIFGVILNIFVIFSNGGKMPSAERTTIGDLHAPITESTKYWFLGDIILTKNYRWSIGDILMIIGDIIMGVGVIIYFTKMFFF